MAPGAESFVTTDAVSTILVDAADRWMGMEGRVGLRHLSARCAAGIINSRYFTTVYFIPETPGEGALS